MPTSRPLFLIRDFLIDDIDFVLEGLAKDPLKHTTEILIPGFNLARKGSLFRQEVEKTLQLENLRVLALVDLPNVNVGFEIGYALGKRVPVALGSVAGPVPDWLVYTPLRATLCEPATSREDFQTIVADECWHDDVPEAPMAGERLLVLCPRLGQGSTLRKVVQETLPSAEFLSLEAWHAPELHEQFAGAARVLWIVAPHAASKGERDGPENAGYALCAGYAKAHGLDVHVFRASQARRVADLEAQEFTFESLEDLETKLLALPPMGEGHAEVPHDPRATYLRYLRRRHRNLVAFFPQADEKYLDKIYVDLEMQCEERLRKQQLVATGESPHLQKRYKLRDLLALEPAGHPAEAQITGRWAILGEPGAGKTTIARHLAFVLGAPETGNTPLPVVISLTALLREGQHPFAWIEEDVRTTLSDLASRDIANLLDTAAHEPGRLWLLLDGLDEVAPHEMATARERIRTLAGALPHVRLAVFSRPIGFQKLGPLFREARLQPLAWEARQELLERWLETKERAQEVWERLQTRAALLQLSGNPLMLTLIASIADARPDLPQGRLGLYDEALTLLLTRGHGLEEDREVEDVQSARVLLRALALHLQHADAGQWSAEELDERVHSCLEAEPKLVSRLRPWQGSVGKFLEDLSRNSGVLGPETGGKRDHWRFLHRQLREFLAAEGLMAQGEDAWNAIFAKLAEDEERIPRWSETLGFLCGLQKNPLALLAKLRDVSNQAALRVLPEVEGVEPPEMLAFLQETKGWDGDDLKRLVIGWKGAFHRELDGLEDLLYGQVNPRVSTERLAFYFYALEALCPEGQVDRERFFGACGRWKKEEVPKLRFVKIEGGTFTMGSPEDEPGRSGSEGPQRDVTVGSFELSAMAVTNAEYERFDPEHRTRECVKEDEFKRYPVVHVCWWEAYLFCRWLGTDVRLPSEVQWEFACRAGTKGPFSFGDNVTPGEVNYWGDHSHPGGQVGLDHDRTVEVGSLPPNQWKLHEMHGNVWEWCQDLWHEDYATAPDDDTPREVSRSSARVVRGGSWNEHPRLCRSAARDWNDPGNRGDGLGFRPARAIRQVH